MDYCTLHYCVTCLLIIVLNIIVLFVCDICSGPWPRTGLILFADTGASMFFRMVKATSI